MSKSIAAINVRLDADIKQYEKNLRQSERALSRSARKWGDLGNSMIAAVSVPVAGFIGRSVQLFDKQAQAIAQVEAGLKSTGMVAGFTSEELQKMASGLQDISTYGDEDILQNVTAQLLTFTNVTQEQFPKAQQAILDLSARLGNDLKSSALQVGKALNDPIKGVSALAKSGIQFTEDQKQVIKSLTETGRIAEAQTIILKELETQFGGSAEAAAKAGLGPIKQFNNSLGDMMEVVGGMVLPHLTVFMERVTGLFKRFDSLEDSTKKTILQVAAFAAAIGPAAKLVSFSIGIYKSWLVVKTSLIIFTKKLTFAQLGLNTAIKANPIGFMVGALAAVATGLAIAYNKSQKFRAAVAGMVAVFFEFGSIVKDTFGNLLGGFGSLIEGNFKDAAKSFNAAFLQMNPLTGFGLAGAKLANAYSEGYQKKIAAEAQAMQEETVKAVAIPIIPVSVPSSDLPTPSGGDTDSGESVNKVRQAIPVLGQLQTLTTGLVASTTTAGAAWEGLGKHIETVKAKAAAFSETLSPMQESILSLGEAIGNNLANGVESFKDFARGVLDAISSVIGALIKQGVAAAVANALKFIPFPANIAAGAAAGGLAQGLFKGLLNKIKPPALAMGGLAYGPTLAMVGDNVGAKTNPEVIAPLDKLKSIMAKDNQGGEIIAETRVSGNDLRILLRRAETQANRTF